MGTPERAARLLCEAYGSAASLRLATPRELARAGNPRGRTVPAWAQRLHAALELAADAACERVPYRPNAGTPRDVVEWFRANLAHREAETFAVIALDARTRIIEGRIVAMGSLARVDVHPREVFRNAIRVGAHSIIVSHNHPSGEVEPSDADLQLTARLSTVGDSVGIPLVDHIIVTPGQALSFASLGVMPC